MTGKYDRLNKTKPRQITQKVESGAAARHRLYQASTASTAVALAAAIAGLVGSRGAAVQSKVMLTTRSASSFRALPFTDCLRRIGTWENLKGGDVSWNLLLGRIRAGLPMLNLWSREGIED